MMQGKILIIVVVTLVIGFSAGFILRPILSSPVQTTAVAGPASTVPAPPSAEARSTQYFATNLDEARRVVAGCGDGSVRGDECANAQQAMMEAEGRDRFKKFMGH